MSVDFAGLSVPGPTITAVTQPFWDAVDDGRLIFQRCTDCGAAVLYPREICPRCWADALQWEDGSGRGRLKTYSIVSKPGHPGWAPAAPYVIGLVTLDEGPTMLSHILCGDHRPVVGLPVEFAPTRVGDWRLPFFRLADG